jgi:hypothetical protein
MKRKIIMLAVISSLVAAVSGAVAQHTVVTDQELMDKLKDAAPAAVLKGATILKMGADGQMKVIQARLPEGRQARPNEALCDVAGNALRTLDAAGQVRMPGRDCDPTPLGAIITSRLEPSRRRCPGHG